MATSTLLVSPPPRETPLLDATGRITVPWLVWFSSISATATIVQNLQTLNVIAEDNSTDANTSSIVAELLDAIALLSTPPRPPDPVPDVDSSFSSSFAALKAEIDELRALIAAPEASPFGGLAGALVQSGGVSGTITIPKLTTANGSITVVNGVITAFVQPT